MRLLTTDQSYHSVEPREWPFAGLQGERKAWQSRTIRLVDGPSGEVKRASYGDLYRDNPWVNGAVRKMADGVQRLPLKVFQVEDGERQEVDPRETSDGRPSGALALARMVRRPHKGKSGQELAQATATDLLVYGNALWHVQPANREIWHIPWANVEVVLGEDEPIVGYEIKGEGLKERTLMPEDCVHFGRGDDPDDTALGLSPLKPLAKVSGLQDAIYRYLMAYFENQARPSGNLKLPQGSGEAELKFIKSQVEELHTGPENAGKVAVTTGDWQHLNQEPEHSQSIELEKLTREQVCAVLGVPEDVLLGKLGGENGMSLRHFYRDVVGPLAERMQDDINAQLIPMRKSWSGLKIEFDLDAKVRPDLQGRAQAFRLLRFVYTVNELRQMEGLDTQEDPRADVVWLPSNEQPLIDPEDNPASPDQGPPGAGDAEPNEFGDGAPAEDQRPTGNEPDETQGRAAAIHRLAKAIYGAIQGDAGNPLGARHPGHSPQSVHDPRGSGGLLPPSDATLAEARLGAEAYADEVEAATGTRPEIDPEGVDVAAHYLETAKQNEAGITADVQDAITGEGGRMEGLDHRMKSPKSTYRKVMADAEEDFDGDVGKVMSTQSLSDTVRFTGQFDSGTYADGASSAIGKLQDEGYEIRKAKNFWQTPNQDNPYNGVNMQMVAPDGGPAIEVQFHTPESLEVKSQMHDLYDVSRDKSFSGAERFTADLEMRQMGRTVPQPSGVDSLPDTRTIRTLETRQEGQPDVAESRTRYFKKDGGGFYRERVNADAEEAFHEYWSESDREWKDGATNLSRYLFHGDGWFTEVDEDEAPAP